MKKLAMKKEVIATAAVLVALAAATIAPWPWI
ncbi:hypothetical protein C7445_10736 [Alicyclobacillus sacchari]|uniref:Uncharacterized protein n=1 Tax=Alicyclobacillus sacchari TaxID=392010 RepID=A0A4R8LNW1_9BACL|nr:hypothetical protein C7445_10736 [Alicyclobacillus sacchari]